MVPSRSPRTVTDPVDGWVRSAANASRVDLPEPLAPSTTHRSPDATDQSIGPTSVVEPRVTVTASNDRTVPWSGGVVVGTGGTAPSVEDGWYGDFNPYERVGWLM